MGKYEIRDIRREDVEEAIHQWIMGRNAQRDRAVVARKLFDGITFERLAEEFGLSVSQAKRIITKYSEIIFRKIRK